LLYPLSYGGWPEEDCGQTDHYEQRSGTLSPLVGIGPIPRRVVAIRPVISIRTRAEWCRLHRPL
jgi:hypothetical protein